MVVKPKYDTQTKMHSLLINAILVIITMKRKQNFGLPIRLLELAGTAKKQYE